MCELTLNAMIGGEVLDVDLLNQFLNKANLPFPAQILMKESREGDFKLIFSVDDDPPVNLSELPVFEHDLLQKDIVHHRTNLWLKCPEQIIVVAIFPEDTFLDEYSIRMLYHLFLPAPLENSPRKPENLLVSFFEESTNLNFENLIQKILEKTISIAMADAGMLWIYDSDINKLVCKAYKGKVTDVAASLQLNLGEGLIGKTFLRGTPKLYSNYDDLLPDIEDFSPDNKTKSLSLFGDLRMDSTFLMPIYVNQQIECILIVYRLKGNPPFSSSDIEILKIFAELIEMTMTNARSLITVQSQLADLQKCNSLYSKLTSLAVNNAGITNIVKELRKAIKTPTLVIDLITQEQFPRGAAFEKKHFDQLIHQDFRNDESFLLESENKLEKYSVHPIFVESSCLGVLVSGFNENESVVDKTMLEIGKMVIALELSKSRSMLDLYFKRIAQNFFELTSLTNPLDVIKKCVEMGIDQNADHAVVVFRIHSPNNEAQASQLYRFIAQIKKELAGTQKFVFSSEEKIITLICAHSVNGRNLVQQQIHQLVEQIQREQDLSIYAGMGSFYSGVKDIDKSYREAENALLYQLSRNTSGLLKYSDLGVNQLFINLSSEEARSFLSKIFSPLRESSKKAESLENTLITYVEENGSVIETAKKLYIHTNTLYQRLRKIETLLQISLRKPEDLLQIQLACYLRKTYPDIYHSLKISVNDI